MSPLQQQLLSPNFSLPACPRPTPVNNTFVDLIHIFRGIVSASTAPAFYDRPILILALVLLVELKNTDQPNQPNYQDDLESNCDSESKLR